MRLLALAVIAVLICLSCPLPVSSQSSSSQDASSAQAGENSEPVPRDMAARMAKQRRQDRYHDLKRDSEKLLEMATELKQYVDKSGENVLSLDVIRKCEQIEKLSKSVRTKMRGD